MRSTMGLVGAIVALAATLAVTSAAPAAPLRGSDQPGVTSTAILLGGTTSLSGPASTLASVARGADAYFKYVNAKGGVHGRRIVYRVVDDASNPAQTVQATRQLVEQEKVFAIFNSLGTEQSLAVRGYLNDRKVPQLFVASGATTLGADYATYPYSSGLQPSYEAEGWVYGKYLARTRPGARIAVLFGNDGLGRDLLTGLKQGLQRSKARVVAAQPYEATASDVGAPMARLKASKADTLALFTTPKFTVQAYAAADRLSWKPKLVITSAASSAASVMQLAAAVATPKLVSGTLSIGFLKDPTDPRWRGDPAMKLYRQVLRQHEPGANPNDVYHVYGMAAAWAAVEVLRKAGKDLTRDALVKAVDRMDSSGNPFLLPGIALKTDGASDHFPIEQMLLQRWQKSSWRSFGGLWRYQPG